MTDFMTGTAQPKWPAEHRSVSPTCRLPTELLRTFCSRVSVLRALKFKPAVVVRGAQGSETCAFLVKIPKRERVDLNVFHFQFSLSASKVDMANAYVWVLRADDFSPPVKFRANPHIFQRICRFTCSCTLSAATHWTLMVHLQKVSLIQQWSGGGFIPGRSRLPARLQKPSQMKENELWQKSKEQPAGAAAAS